MQFKNFDRHGRYYLSSDQKEAYAFALKFDGQFIADVSEAILGNYVVRINDK